MSGTGWGHDLAETARAVHAVPLLLSGIIGVALVGYLVGLGHPALRSEPRAEPARAPGPAVALGPSAALSARSGGAAGVIPSLSYGELRQRGIGPNRDFHSPLSGLVRATPSLLAPVVIAPDDKRRALAARAQLRAYNGAPPTIPHAVEPLSSDACLGCHLDGLAAGELLAPPLPHGRLAGCMQCHVAELRELGAPDPPAGNSYAGLPAPDAGPRAWPGAPPEIPHTTHMREHCLACHGLMGKVGIRTTHPWRRACLQCHASSATLDWVPLGEDRPGSGLQGAASSSGGR